MRSRGLVSYDVWSLVRRAVAAVCGLGLEGDGRCSNLPRPPTLHRITLSGLRPAAAG